MPKSTDEEKAARSAAIQAGTLVSTQVPFETMGLALEALRTAEKLLSGFNDSSASDLGVAAWNLLTCVKGAWLNVCINIGSLKDKVKAEMFRVRGLEILREADSFAETTDPQILAVRARYNDLLKKYKDAIKDEAEKVKAALTEAGATVEIK